MTIHVLRKQGQSIQSIAKQLGLSRNTVKKYLAQGTDSVPRYRPRPEAPSKLDPYKAYLERRIKAAAPDWIPVPVLYEEIKPEGYEGSLRLLNYYLAPLKPRPAVEPVVRFETAPGQQMQVDFTTVKLGRQTVKAFVATLGYSRASYVYFYDNERNESWIDGLRRSFEFFGAVPREVLFDNAKSIVIERDAYGEGEHRWHPNLLDAAKTFGFVPKLCRPYRAKTKGKVERFNQYLKRNFIVPLRATYREVGLELDLATVNAAIGKWLVGTANVRTHDTTKAVPAERLLEELSHMMPLPVMSSAQVEQPAVSLLMTPPPIESLQHPLSLYDTLLGVSYELTV